MKIRNGFISNSSSSSFIAAIFKTKMKMKDICISLGLYSKEDLRKDSKKYKMKMDDLAQEVLCEDGIVTYYDNNGLTNLKIEVLNIRLDNTMIPASFFYQTERDLMEKYEKLFPIEEMSFCIFRGNQ